MNKIAKVGLGALAVVVILAGVGWMNRIEIMLTAIETLVDLRMPVGPNRAVTWDSGADPAGRSCPIAAVRLPAAKRWAEQHWGRGGWAWLTAMLGSAPPTEALLEALTQLLLGTISLATGPGVITSGAGAAHGARGGSTEPPYAGVRRAWGEEAAPQRSKMSIAADEVRVG